MDDQTALRELERLKDLPVPIRDFRKLDIVEGDTAFVCMLDEDGVNRTETWYRVKKVKSTYVILRNMGLGRGQPGAFRRLTKENYISIFQAAAEEEEE